MNGADVQLLWWLGVLMFPIIFFVLGYAWAHRTPRRAPRVGERVTWRADGMEHGGRFMRWSGDRVMVIDRDDGTEQRAEVLARHVRCVNPRPWSLCPPGPPPPTMASYRDAEESR